MLAIKAQPRAKTPGIDGVVEGPNGRYFLKIKLRAKAEDGAANAELLAVLAKALGRPKAALTLETGASARLKTIRIAGHADAVAARLTQLAAS